MTQFTVIMSSSILCFPNPYLQSCSSWDPFQPPSSRGYLYKHLQLKYESQNALPSFPTVASSVVSLSQDGAIIQLPARCAWSHPWFFQFPYQAASAVDPTSLRTCIHRLPTTSSFDSCLQFLPDYSNSFLSSLPASSQLSSSHSLHTRAFDFSHTQNWSRQCTSMSSFTLLIGWV